MLKIIQFLIYYIHRITKITGPLQFNRDRMKSHPQKN